MNLSGTTMDSGKQLRLERLIHRRGDGLFLVPLDHSVADGPVASSADLTRIVDTIGRNGADGVVVHKGRVRFLGPALLRDLALVIHLSASTSHAPDADHKVLVADVEQALRHGADAVSVHVNLGSDTEAQQLADLGQAEGCALWGIPLVAMVYPRGPRITDGSDPALVAHAASLAADLGADIVKTPYTGAVDTMADVVRSCPIPVVTTGGDKADSEANSRSRNGTTNPPKLASLQVKARSSSKWITYFISATKLYASIEDVMCSGAAGVAVGRNVFEAQDVARVTRCIADIVHNHPHGSATVPQQTTTA